MGVTALINNFRACKQEASQSLVRRGGGPATMSYLPRFFSSHAFCRKLLVEQINSSSAGPNDSERRRARYKSPPPVPRNLNAIHRLLSSSFLGLPYRILNRRHKKELLRSPWVDITFEPKALASTTALPVYQNLSCLGGSLN